MNKRKLKKAFKRFRYLPQNKYLLKYICNKFLHFYYKLIGSTKVAYPSTIMLELTNKCNLACTTCPREYEYGKQMDIGKIKLKDAKNIIDQAWPYLDSIGLTGLGESFLHDDLEEIIDYIHSKNKGIIISISTNAVAPNFIKKASRLINKIDTIQVSVDGLGETYNSIRINSDFAKFDKNLSLLSELCLDSHTDLMLNMVVTHENYFQMPQMLDYAFNKGIEYLDFTIFNLAAVTNINKEYYDFYQSKEFTEALNNVNIKKKDFKIQVGFNSFNRKKRFKNCPFPWSHFYISWDGYIPPCCAKPFPKEMNFGNVFTNNLIKVLNNKNFRELRKSWKKDKATDFCANCHFIEVEIK